MQTIKGQECRQIAIFSTASPFPTKLSSGVAQGQSSSVISLGHGSDLQEISICRIQGAWAHSQLSAVSIEIECMFL